MLKLYHEFPLQNLAIPKLQLVCAQSRTWLLFNMQSINCFIIAFKVLLHLTKKNLMFLLLGGMIAVDKIQHQC